MTETKHAPLPWRVDLHVGLYIEDANQNDVAVYDVGNLAGPDEANAAFTVRAVNVHDALVAFAEAIENWISTFRAIA